MKQRKVGFWLLNFALFCSPLSVHALTISANSDVVSGQNTFLGYGLVTTQFDWSNLFADGTHSHGVISPNIGGSSISMTTHDGITNVVEGNINIGNWVDGTAFDGSDAEAVADLAINDIESFDLKFGSDQQSIGFALITGTGNLLTEVDINGASFSFTVLDSSGLAVGSAIFSLVAGMVDQAWLTLTSPIPFRTLQVREIGEPRIEDQYFSNVLAATPTMTPPNVIEIGIDIKPSSFPNSINPASKGVIPAAILTTNTFDASAVDPSTVLFGATGNETAPVQSVMEDVDGDGDTDMILHFKTLATGIQCGDASASLNGKTFSGQMIHGSDSIKTAGCK